MRTVKRMTDNKFLNIKEVTDTDKHLQGYQFAERLGKDSIAFICMDKVSKEYLLNNEYKPPVDEFILTAFGGSMDKDKTPMDIVIAEVKEEAGYIVERSDIYFLGHVFVSTQMNQYCFLYLVLVNKDDVKDREPENHVEAMATPKWVSYDKVMRSHDWKSITIATKAAHILSKK